MQADRALCKLLGEAAAPRGRPGRACGQRAACGAEGRELAWTQDATGSDGALLPSRPDRCPTRGRIYAARGTRTPSQAPGAPLPGRA